MILIVIVQLRDWWTVSTQSTWSAQSARLGLCTKFEAFALYRTGHSVLYCGGGDAGECASKSGGRAISWPLADGACVGASESSAPAPAPGVAESGLCAARCTIRVRAWQKPFPHSSQRNGFSFEWMYLHEIIEYIHITGRIRVSHKYTCTVIRADFFRTLKAQRYE